MLETLLRDALALPDEQGPVGRAVAALLDDASRAGAGDVHLNPGPDGLRILYRVDGALLDRAGVARDFADRFVARVKILAGLPTYRRDVPQDGTIRAAEIGADGDIRVSVLPTIHGEKAVLRLFPHGAAAMRLDTLGFPEELVRRLRAAAARPDGVILLTGPGGSGKTTTIYAVLGEIARPDGPLLRHVVTIEDPVERSLSGVTQVQVHPPTGLTFAATLRSVLRLDPQVILVGEIRDLETAQVATEAGLTGHLVISTVHAGSAAGVVGRLLEMQIEPHVLTASLSCVLAQRLVRRFCDSCRGAGCGACGGTGCRGRIPFGELLEATDALRDAIARRASRAGIESVARAGGMVPLRDAGERLVLDGLVPRDEVRRVLG